MAGILVSKFPTCHSWHDDGAEQAFLLGVALDTDFGILAKSPAPLSGDRIAPACLRRVAMGVTQAAYEAGLGIPKDMSLVGCENTPIAALGPISLTSVDQGPASVGRTPEELPLSRIDGRNMSKSGVFQPS